MARITHAQRFMTELMNEPVALPGCHDVVVTRSFLHSWLLKTGHDPKAKGFASIDYLVFGRKALPVDTPLTDEATRDHICAEIARIEGVA